ncbi:HDOD domain-containing protein [Alkalilimnicola sp. S0819]|uniref:HDOD domain-containing protein n=1 Tax=Alkalilimnicola sp. S0819 TaxID=2613922 RepID=UPI00126181FE|nr:HDOD domain-containing protein [Alkalilimnicola sp. S0819]KAB7628214.1 HDOD domain-containing protein [Alkalilimnicola sp. S0819]MPQ15105.1 HDOD domain-containing protein [Alkalilimnicola sp. S0819]
MTAEQLARKANQLVSLPRAYHRITEMLDDPRYGAADIGKVIAHEPALTARLLRVVNSAYYGLPSKVNTIPMAITILGTRALNDMILATEVASSFAKLKSDLVDMADFWHHSIYCGIMARLLSKRLKIGEPDQLFVAGLLHDIGKLVIYRYAPEQAEQIMARFAEGPLQMYQVEREVLGYDHADVGRALVKNWRLADLYQDTTGLHHEPQRARHHIPMVSVVHAANALTKKVEPGYKLDRPAEDPPELRPTAAQCVPLTPVMVEDLRLEADVQSIEVFSTLFSGIPLND